mmetsp:Transcript_9286/g.11732  ORF Transcript_9286/g.11732 Transcript_9286/m.11732 type:complete len:173 (+) Transcript_9286:150-668(+)
MSQTEHPQSLSVSLIEEAIILSQEKLHTTKTCNMSTDCAIIHNHENQNKNNNHHNSSDDNENQVVDSQSLLFVDDSTQMTQNYDQFQHRHPNNIKAENYFHGVPELPYKEWSHSFPNLDLINGNYECIASSSPNKHQSNETEIDAEKKLKKIVEYRRQLKVGVMKRLMQEFE